MAGTVELLGAIMVAIVEELGVKVDGAAELLVARVVIMVDPVGTDSEVVFGSVGFSGGSVTVSICPVNKHKCKCFRYKF